MSSAPDPAPDPRADLLRQIPSVDELLGFPGLQEKSAGVRRALLADAARTVLERCRQEILRQPHGFRVPDTGALADQVVAEVVRLLAPSLVPVINATGVVLHTNLGRAPLAAEAAERIRQTAGAYSNLEYDLEAGTRGRRDVHTASQLARLAGAEAAVVVNNNAAAVFLVLAALARGGEVVVSRGELIEIGESFRIPDIMAESGAVLREVGTTNRTSLADYERGIGEHTRLLLRVHRSNFRIVGFTARPSLAELVELGRRTGLPVYEDLGSGCLADLSAGGVSEPLVTASIQTGADVVSFSGDKLLGGPQAGIIAGRKELIARVRKHPLFRALRVDKLVTAALEATLTAYLRGDFDAVPALRMVRIPAPEIERRARNLADTLRALLPPGEVQLEIVPGESVIGGGSTPDERLPTCLLQLGGDRWSAAELDLRLRTPASGPAVIARIVRDRLVLDLRTVFPEQEPALASALAAAFR